MSTKAKMIVHQRGNPIANNPLMRKGGQHKKTRSSKRQKHKRETHQLVAKYMGTARRYRHYGAKRSSTGAKRQRVRSSFDDKRYKIGAIKPFFIAFSVNVFPPAFI
jgi:hypothetical protein